MVVPKGGVLSHERDTLVPREVQKGAGGYPRGIQRRRAH